MPEASRPTLLGLPPELRNRIWEMVVFHEPTGGVICPLQGAHGTVRAGHGVACSPYLYHDSMVITSGARFKTSRFQLELPSWFRPNSAQFQGSPAADVTMEELEELWKSSPIVISNHFCTVDCLVQPAITFVNRQVRKESLALFYHVNTFHLEISNFAHQRSVAWHSLPCQDPKPQRAPFDWLRAIGDRNLDTISCFEIVGQGLYDAAESGLMVRYDRRKKTVELMETCGSIHEKFNSPCEYYRRICARHDRIKDGLLDMLNVLQSDGLRIESIEKIVQLLQPKGLVVCST